MEILEDFALSKKIRKQKGAVKVGIIGCGAMGQDIAILVSKKGIDVVFVELSQEKIDEAYVGIGITIDNIIKHWGMTSGDKKLILSRIKGTTSYDNLHDCSIVIESINTSKWVPNHEIRKEVFRKIEEHVSEDCVIASNASTVVISDLAVVLKKPCRSIGLHFIAPVQDVKIIEVNRCRTTSKDTLEFIKRFITMLGKESVMIYGSPGNISTRILVPMINEACTLLMEGVSTVEMIDTTMQKGFGLPLGPFAMADKIGIDKLVKWMEGLYVEFGDTKYKASPLIRRLVRAGMFGEKSGEGFYLYKDGKRISKTGSIVTLGN